MCVCVCVCYVRRCRSRLGIRLVDITDAMHHSADVIGCMHVFVPVISLTMQAPRWRTDVPPSWSATNSRKRRRSSRHSDGIGRRGQSWHDFHSHVILGLSCRSLALQQSGLGSTGRLVVEGNHRNSHARVIVCGLDRPFRPTSSQPSLCSLHSPRPQSFALAYFRCFRSLSRTADGTVDRGIRLCNNCTRSCWSSIVYKPTAIKRRWAEVGLDRDRRWTAVSQSLQAVSQSSRPRDQSAKLKRKLTELRTFEIRLPFLVIYSSALWLYLYIAWLPLAAVLSGVIHALLI